MKQVLDCIGWVALGAATYLVATGLYAGYVIIFRCKKRGDIVKFIKKQNGVE